MPPTTQIRGEQIQDGSIKSADVDDSLEKEFTKLRITTDDSTADFLGTKLVAGPNITFNVVGSSGSNQTLAIASSAGGIAAITGGTIMGITDLAIADGGTGASTAADARTNLGLAIGTNVQAYSTVLDSVTNSTYTGSNSITNVGTVTAGTWSGVPITIERGGTGANTAAAARTSLGLAIGTHVQGYSNSLQSFGSTWTPGVYTNDRWLYTVLSTGSVGMGVDVLNRRSYVGVFGPSGYGNGYPLVLFVANTGSIQIDTGTYTIHPFSSSHTASDLGTTALPFRNVIYSGVLSSSIATGTSPFSVTSTTEVANLNSSRVAGKIPTATPAASALPLAEASGRLNPGWIMNLQTLTDGATINWDMSLGTGATVTLGGTGRTMAAPTNLPPAGTSGKLIIVQDGTGSRTITTWNAVFKWPGGTAITLSTGANKRDIVDWYYDGTSILMLGQYKNY